MRLIFAFLGLCILLVVVALATVAGWVVLSIGRGLIRLIFGAPVTAAARRQISPLANCNGSHPGCNAQNPPHAQFCRRCGERMRNASRIGVRRVA